MAERHAAMVNCYEQAIDSIECVQKIARGLSDTPLQLSERQCQLVARELAETGIFLENNSADLKSTQHVALVQLSSAIKRAERLVNKCCCKDSESWLVAAMMLVEIQEEVAIIVLEIHLWRMLLDVALASARGLSQEQKAEQLKTFEEKYHALFKNLRRPNSELQQAAVEDKRMILSRVAGHVHESPDELENLRAVYVQSLLTPESLENAASMKLNDFKLENVLGRGGCGMVFKVRWLGVSCALKILNVQDEREATALKGLFHPNIIRLFHYWVSGSEGGPLCNPTSHLLMELMPTDLGAYMKLRLKSMPSSSRQDPIMPFSLPVAIDIMEQVARAVQYMHDHRHLSHRDLKPSNILVKERDGERYLDIKLADFGLAKAYEHTSTGRAHTVNTGTPLYGAPEIFGKDLASLERSVLPMADVWSFGITCAEILTGKNPYAGEPTQPRLEFQRRISKEGLRPTLPVHCPPYLAFCISSCWELLPERRPSFASLRKLLRHAKLLSLGVTDLEDSKLFFAYTTRSGHVKCLHDVPKSSMGERFSTLIYTSMQYLSLKHLVPGGLFVNGSTSSLPHEAYSRISNSTGSNQASSLSDVGQLQEHCDVGESRDHPHIVTPDDATSVKSNLHGGTKMEVSVMLKEHVAVEPAMPPSSTKGKSPSLYRKWTDVDAIMEYTLKEIIVMTDSFRHELGRSAQGVYYSANSHPDDPVKRKLAVKKLQKDFSLDNVLYRKVGNRSAEVIEEFWSWLHTVSKLYHRNLVKITGFCIEEENMFLVHEYMAMGSLEQLLHPEDLDGTTVTMNWKARMRCAIEVAQGLNYLHSHAEPSIVHRDVKPGTILFDEDMQAKLVDFGWSNAVPSGHQPPCLPAYVLGTLGYVDPVYLINGVPCDKNDVYSYGVVLLELITGRRAIQQGIGLVAWCRDFFFGETVMRHLVTKMVDTGINRSEYSEDQLYDVVKVAHMCVEDKQEHRPTMKDVVVWLYNANCKDYSTSESSSLETTLDFATINDSGNFKPVTDHLHYHPRPSYPRFHLPPTSSGNSSSYVIRNDGIIVMCTVGNNQRVALRCKIWPTPKNFGLNNIEATLNGAFLWKKGLWWYNAKSSREFSINDEITLIAEWHTVLRVPDKHSLPSEDPRRHHGPFCVEYLALKGVGGRPVLVEYLGDKMPLPPAD